MKTVSSTVEINASPERVWAIFTDLPGHASWDPFITAISGPLPVWQGRVRHSSGIRSDHDQGETGRLRW